MQTGRGKTRSGGVDIPVCPNAMTEQRLEHGLKTIGADRNVSEMKMTLQAAATDAAGKEVPAVTLNWGNFVNTVIDFLIVAMAIFIVIRLMNAAKKKEAAALPPAPPAPPKEQVLLEEIRDLLKSR